MFKKLRPRITYANVMATVAVVLVVGGGALAVGAIPGPDGRIHSCYKTAKPGKGKVRIVGHAATCKATETRLAWNQRGPKGDRGLRGLRGFEGDQGDQGVPGPTESAGANNLVQIDSEIALDSNFTALVDLDNVNGQGGTQQISPSFPSKILATANVTLQNADTSFSGASCKLQISDGTGPANGFTDMGPVHFVGFPAINNYAVPVTLVGSVNKPAGTYNIRMVCDENTAAVKASSGDIWAIATQQ